MKSKFIKLALSFLISSSLFSPSQAEANILSFFRNLLSPTRTTSVPTKTLAENILVKGNKCLELYKTSNTSPKTNNTAKKLEPTEISDLKSFGEAMTQGMLLSPEQSELFEIYRKIYFGDPNTSVNNETLKSVTDILEKHPELQKPHFREYEISQVEKVYKTPESLSKYLKSQIQTAGEVRNNLLQIEANFGFWKKVLDYQDLPMPDEIKQMQSKLGKDSLAAEKEAYRNAKSEFEAAAKKRFETYLNRMISRKNRELLAELKNDKEDYQKKAKSLFTTLKYIQEWMDKKGRNTQTIRQAMVDLVHTVGYGNQATQSLLKSKNAMERIEGLKKVIDERDAVAMDLGYEGHFQELQTSLKIEFPTGLSKNENPSQNIQKLEQEILSQGKFTTKPTETIRVRSLSIQEAPFRSCLGGSDCSTRTYFSKALDPNYNYFTMTDSQNHSSGHLTVVLGEAMNSETNKKEKVAFIDKLQNVPNRQIPSFLQAVSLSLREKGYKLGVPEDVGELNGLSNEGSTRLYIAQEVVPKLTHRLTTFVPHSHQYEFKNEYSRAYDKLNVKIYEPLSLERDTEVKPGLEYPSFVASKNLDKNNLIQDLLNLKNSQNPNDVLKYVFSGQVVAQLEKLGLFSIKEFEKDLVLIVERAELPFSIRKQAAFEALLIEAESNQNQLNLNFKGFNEVEKTQIFSEIRQWIKSTDKRKKNFADNLNDKWVDAIVKGDIKTLESFVTLKLFDINSRSVSGFSSLRIAIHHDQKTVVEWLIQQPNLDLNHKDDLGFTDIEQARLMGKNEMADFIEEKRPEVRSRKFIMKERNDDGSPIVKMVKIPAGTFRMGSNQKGTVTITKSFEIMSVKTTQLMWKGVVDLANLYLKDDLNFKMALGKLKASPSIFRWSRPAKQSYFDITMWLEILNALSKINDLQMQNKLKGLLSESHYLGKKYRLPTEAEWEYTSRMRGLATADSVYGNTDKSLINFASFIALRPRQVGRLTPVMTASGPIYDITGNVLEWVKDPYVFPPALGGIDPQGPETGYVRVVRYGGWYTFTNDVQVQRLGFRYGGNPASVDGAGFRLVSDIP